MLKLIHLSLFFKFVNILTVNGAAIANTAMSLPFVTYFQTYLLVLTELQYSTLQCPLNILEFGTIQLLSSTTFLFFTSNIIVMPLSSIEQRRYRGNRHCLWLSHLTMPADNVWSIYFRSFPVVITIRSMNHIHYFIQLWICFEIRNFCVNNGVCFIRSYFFDHPQKNTHMRQFSFLLLYKVYPTSHVSEDMIFHNEVHDHFEFLLEYITCCNVVTIARWLTE